MSRVITFYSYKGGTGRSMALANVAWVLASTGKRVLAIDWDLEAPGLHRYFRPFLVDKELTGQESEGVIDMVVAFATVAATAPQTGEALGKEWFEKHADFSKWKRKLQWPNGDIVRLGQGPVDSAGQGGIDFVPAGRQDLEYAQKVNFFDWRTFYEKLNGGAFLDAARRKFDAYDYVLIDSRTGVSDTSGICTMHLPDTVVVCFTLNYQSIKGAAAVAASIRQRRPDMRIFPVPMRIDGSEEKLLNRMKRYCRGLFTPLLDSGINAEEYWFSMEVAYAPRYAYAEKLALFEERTSITASMLPAMERLTWYLTDRAVANAKALPEELRKSALLEYDASPLEDMTEVTRGPLPIAGVNGAWSLYRQCAMTSRAEKLRLETLLKVSLYLCIFGAVLGTVTSVITNPESNTFKILGVVGSVAVALAGVAATQALAGDRQKVWLKCRAAGESLKSAIYLACAATPPFDGPDRAVKLAQTAEKAMKDVDGIPLRPSNDGGKEPPGAMTVTDYISLRIDEQIHYYTITATKFEKNADFWKYFAFAGAAVSATLGAISTLISVTPWVALLATLVTSMTAYVNNQLYESMISLYQTTATRLQLLRDQWLDSGKSDADKAERNAFIQRCEETMAAENGAWLAQWSQAAPTPTAATYQNTADR